MSTHPPAISQKSPCAYFPSDPAQIRLSSALPCGCESPRCKGLVRWKLGEHGAAQLSNAFFGKHALGIPMVAQPEVGEERHVRVLVTRRMRP